ncbi:MAG: lamin tail domain-containing protein [Akkermansiaceae bacterium]|nr:lamin tail domain-containing protein [Akkermansiaceae bacterium]
MRIPSILGTGLALLASVSALSAEQIVFSEIHYHPKDGKPEYVEINNLTATPFDIAKWKISDGIDYEFPEFDAAKPAATYLQPFEYIVVSAVDEATLRAAYSIPSSAKVYGPWVGTLDNSGERIALEDKNGVLRAEVSYDDDGRKWPVAADGAGHSLRLLKPNRGGSNWRNWTASSRPGGTPGALPSRGKPLADLLALSEVHFAADGSVDWVELHARGNAAVVADDLSIASQRDFSNAVPLAGTIAVGGYASWDVAFPTEVNGDVEIYVFNSAGTVVAAQKFTRDAGQEGFQSVPVGEEWFGGPGHTRDAPNAPSARNTNIIINEIMYDPPSDARTGEFVELYNRGSAAVDLGGWSFVEGIDFTFPTGTTLGPGAYLVVAADAAWMTAHYGAIRVVGDFSGQLGDSGELLRLEDGGGNLADQVDYLPSGDWPELADGDGSSMELKNPAMDNDSPSAWADSDESGKSPMQPFTYTAKFEQATWSPITSGQELHLHLVGDSHVILENFSFTVAGSGTNLLVRSTGMSRTNSSAGGWVCQGTHWASFMSSGQLNLISDGHGDNKANRAEIDLGNLAFNQTYTLSFDARWVSGKSRLIAQTLDHGFGASFRLPIPNNLGTPGLPNSRLAAAPAPTVGGVLHSPAVPSPSTPVKVTAQVASAGALAAVELVHRLDTVAGTSTWSRATMYDDGLTGGDEQADDGVYTATVTQYQSQGNIVQFYVEAVAAGGAATMLPKLGPARPAMWIVDSRVMPNTLMRERFIISQHDRQALIASSGDSAAYGYNFPRMSNHFFNATFISNESEVFYNAEVRKSGSPFTRDSGNALAHGKWKLPGDRLFRERHRSVFDASGTAEGSGTPRFYDDRIARYFLYLLGHPTNEMEFVHWVVNGDSFKLRENHEPISNDFLDRNWDGGSDGTLLRVDDEWRFTSDDGEARQARDADWSYKNSDNPIRYHSEWLMRSRENDYDYGNFIEFVRTLRDPRLTDTTLDRMADRDMLCLNAAVRGYDADWDTLTVDRGKNTYFYRPKGGRWMLLHWDGDRVFENTSQAILGNRPGLRTYFDRPAVRRVMNYYLSELLSKYTKGSARTAAWMDMEVAATAGTGIYMPKSHYVAWFANRESMAKSFIGGSFSTGFAISTSSTPTSADVLSLSGTSPSTVYQVRVAEQPWIEASWTNTTTWRLSGITLKAGENTFTVEGVNHQGVVVQSKTFTITKTGDAAPVMALEGSPGSFNVALSEGLDLDASASYDPDGGALSFGWEVAPTTGVALSPAGGLARASFSRPGLYRFTATGTDSAGNSTPVVREAAVFGGEGFSSFSATRLERFWEESNVEVTNNTAAGPWYSLLADPGHLLISVPGESAYPLGTAQTSGTTHPWIKRRLPAAGDWILQTDLELYGLQFGSFMAGLMVEVDNGGDLNRYGFGYLNGDRLAVMQLTGSANPAILYLLSFKLSSEMRLRIRRDGDDLVFESQTGDLFQEVYRVAIAAGGSVTAGGPFVATESPQFLNVSFDYVMLIDPSPITPPTDALVVSEVMYKPLGGENYEYLELYNTGATAINLAGFRFPQGEPFDEFVFGEVTIGPWQYLLVVNDLAAFRSRHGNSFDPIIGGEWVGGSLSNSGEIITLLDTGGNVVISFGYSDLPPWPTSPDTMGTSLVLINPAAGNSATGTDWSASLLVGGNPGGAELDPTFAAWMAARGEFNPFATKPGEPVSNLLSYAFGLDLAGGDAGVALPRLGKLTTGGESFFSYEYRRRLSAPTLGYAVEISRDGRNWSDASADLVQIGVTAEGDGTERVKVRLKDPLGSERTILLRVRVTTL